ncbi:MAG TPA: FG-GAP-like repeat-containing protein [Bryobacteraceae bacterium]|nr:FG-GAP-like repeat-containing protein [Bryobacteraceae bacterium]
MKRALAFGVLVPLYLISAYAQPLPASSKMTAHLQMLVSGNPTQVEQARRTIHIRPRGTRGEASVSVFIRFQGSADALRATLETYGAAVKTAVGNLATAEIPVNALSLVAALPTIQHIEEAVTTKPNLDVSVPATGANQIWYGAGGPVAVGSTTRGAMPPPWSGNTGRNAIIGIVDTGVDLTHKDFLDSAGNTRILSLWDQTTSGTPPAAPAGHPAYTGNECTPAQINALHQKTDVMFTNPFTGTMSFLTGGAGFGGTGSFSKGHNAASVVMADFNRDGHVDALTGNLDGTISWVQFDGNSFAPQNPITVAASNVQITALGAADLNHDGFTDVVAVLYTSNQIAVLLGNGDGTFKPPSLITVGGTPDTVAIGDLNGDGHADLVVGNYNDGTVSVLLGDGTGVFAAAANSPVAISTTGYNPNSQIGSTPSNVAIADLNGDGRPDLAVAGFGRQGAGLPGPNVWILLGNGDGTFGTPTSFNTNYFAMSMAVGDFNRDGIPDLAVESYSINVSILLGRGDGTFNTPVDYPAGGVVGLYSGQTTIAAGDFNGDGLIDIINLVRSNTPNGNFYDKLALLPGHGDGTFGTAILYSTDPGGNSSYLAVGNLQATVCTEVDTDGHGTNVASIAAGNGSAGGPGVLQTPYRYIGMAPEAGIIVVKTTFDTPDVVNAVSYIESKAFALGKPVAINLSLGSVTGPHDGTSSFDTMTSALAAPGYIVVGATGNEGDKNLHVAAALPDGQTQAQGFTMPANLTTPAQLDLWYRGEDQFGVNVVGPAGMSCLTAAVYPGTGTPVTSTTAACGTVTVSVYFDPANSDHQVNINFSNGANPIPPGNWTINVIGSGCGVSPCVVDGRFDIWSTDMPFTSVSATRADTINEPASGANLIAVGAYVTKTSWLSLFSSVTPTQGPDMLANLSSFSSAGPLRTCSGTACLAPVQKPDVAAPGETILAAYAAGTPTAVCSFAGSPPGACLDSDGQHIAYQGTSMATPHVTGAVALMLSQSPAMTVCEAKAALSHARADAFTGAVPNPFWGYGKLAADLAIAVQPMSYTVPNVVGFSTAAANTAISAAKLTTGAVNMVGGSVVPAGQVISQDPAAGSIWCGAVNLLVSSGLQSIQVTPANPTIAVNGTQQFTATGNYGNNITSDITAQVTWVSATAATATMSLGGVATAVANGDSTITASLDGVVGITQLVVGLSKCDIDGSGSVNLTDVQRIIDEALGLLPPVHDLNGDGHVDAADVQILTNAALGLGCAAH